MRQRSAGHIKIYKDKILKAKDIDTKVTGRSTGHPVRALRNEMTKQYLDLEKKGATLEELEYLTLGGLRKAVVEGDVKKWKCHVWSDSRNDQRGVNLQGGH